MHWLSVALRRLSISLSRLSWHALWLLAWHRLTISTVALGLLAWSNCSWHSTISRHRRLTWHWLAGHGLPVAAITWHLAWSSTWRATWRLVGRSTTARSNLSHQVILLQVATELVVIDALLQPDEDVVEFHVELSALLQLHGELLLHDDSLVDRGEELLLLGVVANAIYQLVQLRAKLLDHAGNGLLLGFVGLVLRKVLHVIRLVLFKDLAFVGCA